MEASGKLIVVKTVHTFIWMFFVAAIFYVVYAGVTGNVSGYVWIAIGLVVLEGVVLVFNQWRCPLTLLGRLYTDDTADNFDIFLPVWLAKNNKFIFTSIFVIGVLLVILRIAR